MKPCSFRPALFSPIFRPAFSALVAAIRCKSSEESSASDRLLLSEAVVCLRELYCVFQEHSSREAVKSVRARPCTRGLHAEPVKRIEIRESGRGEASGLVV